MVGRVYKSGVNWVIFKGVDEREPEHTARTELP
jgi:hypothetical protein